MSTPGKPNIDKSELLFAEFIAHPEIARDYLQVISRLMGWDDGNETWRFVNVNADGQIETNLTGLIGDTGVNSNVSVTTTSTVLLAANVDRKYFLIQNTTNSTLFLRFGSPAIIASSTWLSAYSVIEGDYYTGEITGITAGGAINVSVLEIT